MALLKEMKQLTVQFSKAEMQKLMKTVKKSVKDGKKQPSSVKMKALNGKTYDMKKKQYCGLLDNQVKFYMNKGRYPNYTTYLYDADTPFRGLPQSLSWNCGSTSLSNASSQVLCYATEKRCREACKTTKNGTTPANLINGAKKLDMKVEKINRTFNAVKKAIDDGYGVIAHIETGGATKPPCLSYQSNFGHWVCIYNYTSDYKFKVYDPTKGYKVCNANQIIKATNGRAIYFYQVKPL